VGQDVPFTASSFVHKKFGEPSVITLSGSEQPKLLPVGAIVGFLSVSTPNRVFVILYL